MVSSEQPRPARLVRGRLAELEEREGMIRGLLRVANHPGPFLGVGVLATLAALLAAVADLPWPVIRIVLVFVAALSFGVSLTVGWRQLGDDFVDRLSRAGLPFLAGVQALVCAWVMAPLWDSIGLLLGVAGLVGLVGAGLVLLPRKVRLLTISLLALVHFGGIATAIVAVPPPNGPPAWWPQWLWIGVYRPWLQLTHLTNAYHFYSPEPGPVALVYFRVTYTDGTTRWVRIPDHQKTRSGLETRRLGALATSLGQSVPVPPLRLDQLATARRDAGNRHNPPIGMADLPLPLQYREPAPQTRMQIESYVRFVARHNPHPTDPTQGVEGIKVYCVEFHNPSAEHLRQRLDPLDPTLYWWYYVGDYTPDGVMKPSCLRITWNDEGAETERVQDPFLYWMLPVVSVPVVRQGGATRDFRIFHSARAHAGDKDTETNP
jgi:hypothetical protein